MVAHSGLKGTVFLYIPSALLAIPIIARAPRSAERISNYLSIIAPPRNVIVSVYFKFLSVALTGFV